LPEDLGYGIVGTTADTAREAMNLLRNVSPGQLICHFGDIQ
jgi:hypothetical protein